MTLKERLDEELKDVVFSSQDQARLKAQLRHQLQVQRQQKPSGLMQRLDRFWNGSTEIPLPAALALILVLGLGLWTSYATLLAVDQTTAALIIKVGSDNVQVITQGVSVL